METHKIDPNKLPRSETYSPEILEDMKALTWLCSRGWTCIRPGKGETIGWKPSEEQMASLAWWRRYSGNLESLYDDLKKLM